MNSREGINEERVPTSNSIKTLNGTLSDIFLFLYLFAINPLLSLCITKARFSFFIARTLALLSVSHHKRIHASRFIIAFSLTLYGFKRVLKESHGFTSSRDDERAMRDDVIGFVFCIEKIRFFVESLLGFFFFEQIYE
jgi:hypothetical protein